MKLIVQIPCLNEEKTLPITISDIPKVIEGVDKVEILVIDDGSTDGTVEVARKLGVDHIISIKKTRGLARTFMAGLDTSLKLGADIIVNTDGDNQYQGEDIPKLIQPILEGRADMVIGTRDIDSIKEFSLVKKKLQKLGSWVVRSLSGTDISDTTSGFRAYSRKAALSMNIISPFSYTLESIIQASQKDIVIASIPIRTNGRLRKSRLFSSLTQYIKKSASTIIRIYTMFQPLRVFFYTGGILFSIGFLIGLRFLYFFFLTQERSGHLQSLILSAVLLILGFMLLMIGLVADIISANRILIEDTLYRIRKMELGLGSQVETESTVENQESMMHGEPEHEKVVKVTSKV